MNVAWGGLTRVKHLQSLRALQERDGSLEMVKQILQISHRRALRKDFYESAFRIQMEIDFGRVNFRESFLAVTTIQS